MNQVKGKYLMVLIAACGMIGAALGMITNVAGLFFSPIAEELNTGIGNVSMTLTISNLIMAIGGVAVPKLIHSKSFKPMLLVGTIGIAGATAGLALAPNLILLYILNAVRGFAAGVLGTVTVTILINNWFRTNVGLVTSIAMGFSGIVSAVLSPVLSAVIESAGWRVGYLTAAVIMLALELPAILLPIDFHPEDADLKPLGKASKAELHTDTSAARAVSTSLFIMVLVFSVIVSFATAFPQHFSGVAGAYGFTTAVGSGMLSVCMVMNTAGKIIFGVLADRFGAKKSILLFGTVICTALLLMLFVQIPGAMFVAAGLFGLSYALATVGTVLTTKDAFGLANYSKVYPKITIGTTIANAVGSSLIGFFFDGTGSYFGSMVLIFGLLLVMLGIIVAVYRKADTLAE